MINQRLTSREAAERLGVKQATLYAYVSRGLLHPERTARGSTFDVHEVAQLARTARNPARIGRRSPSGRPTAHRSRAARIDPDRPPGDPAFVTELTLIGEGRLYYRGLDAAELARTRSFEAVAEWLWAGEWPEGQVRWLAPEEALTAAARALGGLPDAATALERFTVAVVAASLCDDLRHDLNPSGVPVTGRSILRVLAGALPLAGPPAVAAVAPRIEMPYARRVWAGLTERAATRPGVAAVDAALVLAADHELAPSTLAARVAASFRADPYAVVLTGLGPAGGSWQRGSTGAPNEVERLLAEAEEVGAERAIGGRLRRGQDVPYGFGMPLYPDGDPRAHELLARLDGVGPAGRLALVRDVIDVGRRRGFPPPNFDLGLGALSYCAGMVPGAAQALFTLGKVAGWLAHAIEEYVSPTRFRSRADYVGAVPAGVSEL